MYSVGMVVVKGYELIDLPLGIDVSNNNGPIDWKKVAAAGVKFAWMKVSQSTDYKDTYLEHNWKGSKDNGLYRGGYHYAKPWDNPDARTEANWFYDCINKDLDTGDCLALDMEDNTPGNLGPWTLYWLQVTQSYFNFAPHLYTAPTYVQSLQLNIPELANYPLWLANWRETFPSSIPSPWKVMTFWQQSATGSIDGIDGDVDLDYFNGTLDRIPLLGKPGIATTPTPSVTVAELCDDLDALIAKFNETIAKLREIK